MRFRSIRNFLLSAFCLFPAVAQTPPSKTPAETPIELHHIDVTLVDKSVSPCVNFYQYSCGKLNAANPIPADQVAWGSGAQLAIWNRQVLRSILERNAPSVSGRTPNQQKIGDFYAACRTQASSGANNFPVLQPLLARIAAISSPSEIAGVLAAMQRSFGRTWESGDNQTDIALFGFGPTPDYNDVHRIVGSLDQGGLGMPGRDFYLDDTAENKKIRESYVAYIVAALQLAGGSPAEAQADAATILRFETSLARAQMDNVTRRDPAKLNNRFTLAQVKTLVPAFEWDTYFHTLGAPAISLYEVSSPSFFRTVNTMLSQEDLATWKIYLRWQLLLSASPALGNAWRTAEFGFHSAVTGQKQQAPAWRRCTSAVDNSLGEALGQVYVAEVFPPESKVRAQRMVKDIEAAMGRDIDAATWMAAQTKAQAHRKLAAVLDKIGYPDKWIDYTSLSVTPDNFALDMQRATAFELHRQLALIGKPLDRTLWSMTPPTVDAYENPQENTINFPAGILQPVFFDATRDDVINYGSEGAVVGHELTHDFDDQGRKFDVDGNLHDWWTAEDAKQYDQRGSCIATEYTGPVPGVTGVQQNGKLTQGEDTADNGGLYLALSALALDLQGQGKTLADKDKNDLTNLQRFFLAFGNSWCDQLRPELARTLVLTDPHSIPELRVNNVVSNMPEFQQAFGCKVGQPMVHPTRCRVW